MPFRFKNPHRIRVILAIAVIFFGLATIGLAFAPSSNPPECQGIQHPDRGDNCIIGANIGVGFIFLYGLISVWLGISGLLASFAYRANQYHQQTKHKWLQAVTTIVFVTPFILSFIFFRITDNQATESIKQEEAAFQEKYRSEFIVYSNPPNWNEVTKESESVSYTENSALALYLDECETGRSDAQYANGRTYFVFSGVKDNNCVFYIHTQSAVAGAWDSLLRTKCVWDVDSGNINTPIFSVGPNGIEFGDFITNNCDSI